ncbi:MAG: hypothetical protein NVS3B10_08650 [Polyangiales bacterium]
MTVSPAGAGGAGRAAARRVAAELAELAPDADCGAMSLEVVSDQRAYLLFTTSDGRQAMRELRSADQLAAVVDALLVTPPREESLAPAATTVAPVVDTSTGPGTGAGPGAADGKDGTPALRAETAAMRAVSPDSSSSRLHMLGMVGGGARGSGPGNLISPSAALRLGIQTGAWELFGFGEWDPVHKSSTAPVGFKMVRYAVGIGAGRRFSLGPAALSLGATTSVAMTNSASNDANPQSSTAGSNAQSSADPLVGAYAGVELPARSSLRLRGELSTAVVLTRLGGAAEADSLPSPWWTSALSLGVVWEVL